MRIYEINIDNIKPYENNPRFNDEAVEPVKNSIREFGFKVPIVIDKDNVIITGHTRYKACKELGIKKIPCIRADDLTDEQVKAFRVADNSVSDVATWDFNKLEIELQDLDIDLSDFGLDLGGFDMQGEEIPADDGNGDFEADNDDENVTRERVLNILNLGIAQYDGVGAYDIPEIKPVYNLPEITEWIGFNYVLSDPDPVGKAVHFFCDDYQFERLWHNPERYIEKLKQYVCVASPDFSPYGDMPLICQVFNHYRKQWVGRFLQEHGVTVIPTVRCSTDERSHEWFLDGIPRKSIIIMSSMWSKIYTEDAMEEYQLIKEHLHPKKIFMYGGKGGLDIADTDNVEFIKNFVQGRYGGKE